MHCGAFVALLRRRGLAGKAVAVIGPVTAEALVNKGITPDVLPDEWTTAGMAVAIESYFANQQGLP